jgi:CubicO group peptidase (beta-lactamase class C family)
MIDGTQVISKASMEEMHSPQCIIATTPEMRAARHVEFFGAYGLGWQIMDYRGEKIFWHTGNADGMPAYMAILPKRKLGVAVMMNTWGAGFLHATIAGRIIDSYLGVALEETHEDLAKHEQAIIDENRERESLAAKKANASRAPQALSAYRGVYHADLWGDTRVDVQKDKLMMALGKGEKAILIHDTGNTFFIEWNDPVLRSIFYNTQVTFHPEENRLEMQLNRDQVEATRQR